MAAEAPTHPWRRSSRVARVLRAAVQIVGLVFIAAVVFLLWAFKTGHAVQWVRQQVLSQLHDRCGVVAKFDALTAGPFPPTIEMTGLEMSHLDGRPLISVEDAIVTLQVLPLFARRLQLDRVAVLGPRAALEIAGGRILDLPRCIEPTGARPRSAPVVLGIRELTVERGRFDLRVEKSLEATLDGIGVSLTPRGSGGAELAVGVDHSVVRIDGRPLDLRRFRLLGQIEGLLTEPRAALIERMEIELGRGRLAASGSIDLFGPVYDARVVVDAPLDAAHDFLTGLPETEGDVHLDFKLQGTAATPHGLGHLTVVDGRVGQFEIADRLDVDFTANRHGIEVSALEAALGDGKVRARGKLAFDDHLTLRLETEEESLAFGRLIDSLGIHRAWVDWRAFGRGAFNGTLVPLELRGAFDFDLRDFYVFDRGWDTPEARAAVARGGRDPHVILHPAPVSVRGFWGWNERGITFSEAQINGGASVGTADAHVAFASTEGIDIRATFTSLDFADVGPVAGIQFSGHGSLVASLSGPVPGLRAGGALDLDEITIAGIPFGRAVSDVAWYKDTHLEFQNIRGHLGDSDYRGDVRLVIEKEAPFSIQGSVEKGRIEDLLVPFHVRREDAGQATGAFTATFDLSGPVSRLNGPIDLVLGPGSVLDEAYESGKVHGRLERGAVVIDDAELVKYGARIAFSGAIDPYGGGVRAEAHARELPLQAIDLVKAAQPELDGRVALDLALGGRLEAITGTVSARISRLAAGPLELPEARVTGAIAGRRLQLKGRLLGDGGEIEGDLTLARGLPYDAEIVLRGYDLPRLVGALDGHLRYRGTVTGRAHLQGSLIDWGQSSGEIQLEHGQFESEAFSVETGASAALTLKTGVLHMRRLSLIGPGTKLTADGRLGARLFDVKLAGKVDLGAAAALSPSIEKVAGSLAIDGALTGAPGAMNLLGTGHIDDGVLQWRGLVGRLTALSADLSFSQATILIERGEGRWADGTVGVTGSVQLDGPRLRSVLLQFAIQDAIPELSLQTADMSGLLRGAVTLEGAPTKLSVHGELDVSRGKIRPKIDPTRVVGSSRGGGSGVYDPSREVLDLDLGFHSRAPIHVKSEAVDFDMTGDLRLTGTNQRIGMVGTLSVPSGGRVMVTTLGRQFEVISGTFEFQDRYRFYPRYVLAVATEACSARIRVNLVGTIDDVDITYSANPAMDELNIKNCIFQGVKLQDLDYDSGRVASNALWRYTGLDREVRKVLPVDDIDVTYEYSIIARDYEPRVLVAKDLTLFGGSVRLEYASSLVKNEDRRVALRYRITPQLTLQGGWVSQETIQPLVGDLGLDLKYRWEW